MQKINLALIALAAIAPASASPQNDGPPPFDQKAETARWMTKHLSWGTVSTISATFNGVPFGNPNSFVAIKGHIYFYVSSLDATMQDVAKDPRVSLTVTEAQIPGRCGPSNTTDPEEPVCARLVITGTMEKLPSSQLPAVKEAMFALHPRMKAWPESHDFFFTTLNITNLWLIDIYGGAAIIKPDEYYAVDPGHNKSLGRALCPVTGANITIGNSTPTVSFKNGQELYFSSKDAADKYRASPRDFWLSPHDIPAPTLPQLTGETRYCPQSNEKMVISMRTPRVLHRYGQAVYFCCFGCVEGFWTNPVDSFA